MEPEVAFPGAPSLVVRAVSADVKQHTELEPASSEQRSCVKAEMTVLGSPSLTVLMVSVNVKQH